MLSKISRQTLIFLIVLFSLVNAQSGDGITTSETQSSPCVSHWLSWSEWSNCINSLIVRRRACVCDDGFTVVNPVYCSGSTDFLDYVQTMVCGPASQGFDDFNDTTTSINDTTTPPFTGNDDDDDDESDDEDSAPDANDCRWHWSRWTFCTKICGSGLTNRTQRCLCEGSNQFASDDECDPSTRKYNETVNCNEHPCGSVKAHNKLYWLEQHNAYFRAQIESDGKEQWPYANPRFNCSDGEDPIHPKSNRHIMDVLHEIIDSQTFNLEWTLLAREYAAALLNVYSGYDMNQEADTAIAEAEKLLEKCDGYSNDQMVYVFAAKEKLSRFNNNIGGLGSVDSDLGIASLTNGGSNGIQSDEGGAISSTALVVVVTVPIATVLIVAGVVLAACFVLKHRQHQGEYGEVFDASEESENQDDEALVPPTPTPLNLPRVAERVRAGEDEDSDDSTGDDSK